VLREQGGVAMWGVLREQGGVAMWVVLREQGGVTMWGFGAGEGQIPFIQYCRCGSLPPLMLKVTCNWQIC
jgi:hypothetical protein